jgi:integrase
MASIYKHKYTRIVDGRKVKKQSKCYYIKFRDHRQIDRRVPACREKRPSEAFARTIEALVACRIAGIQPDPELTRRLEEMPPDMRDGLAKAGVLSTTRVAASRLLTEHLEDWKQSLLSKGSTEGYVDMLVSRATSIVEGCGFRTFSDVSASKVETFLKDLRGEPKKLSAQTSNFYLQSVKQFCKWMVENLRAIESPVRHLKGLNVRTDRRHDRRGLEVDEMRRLLKRTAEARKRFGMTGPERAMLYRLAVETGLRANELRTLRVSSFDLNGQTVTVLAGYSKHRREDILPLRPDTAGELRMFLAGKTPDAQVFRVPGKPAKMFQADLAATEEKDESGNVAKKAIPYMDDAGRYADFHALRHTTGTWLAANGVHPKVMQEIMRHSDINLTMRYTHTLRGQEAKAIRSLPDLSAERIAKTGTDD